MGKVLIIDDDQVVCRSLQAMIGKAGHEAFYATTLSEGVTMAVDGEFDVVFLDVMMPDGSGLDSLQTIQEQIRPPEVIIITSTGTADGAEIALQNGAWDYLEKPLSPRSGILLQLKRVFEYRNNLHASPRVPRVLKRRRIIGDSRVLDQALEQLGRAAGNDSNVLILGETGTGKEVFARTLHENSHRAEQKLVIVDCAALPANLIESTLFGHVKGAFTGAESPADGLVKLAHRGSLFFDEIGELDLALQKALLRLLQEKTYRPVGSGSEQRSDFRLIAATNRDLQGMVDQGTFREDLYFRLCTQLIHLPPLRKRLQDIELLVVKHLRELAAANQWESKSYSPDFIEALQAHAWPGNVRELLHTVEQAFFTAGKSPILLSQHLPGSIRLQAIQSRLKSDEQSVAEKYATAAVQSESRALLPPFARFREESLSQLERYYLEQLMAIAGGSLKEAMRISQLGRTRLYTLLKKHNLSKNGEVEG